MSYSTYDRHGGICNCYTHSRGGGNPDGGSFSGGGYTWWPDFGPSGRDHSFASRAHPTDHIFEKHVVPKHWSTKPKDEEPAPPPQASQFMHPVPHREAMLQTMRHGDLKTKFAAHEATEKQAALRRAEQRQRRVDAYMESAPIFAIPSSSPKTPVAGATALRSTSSSSFAAMGKRSNSEPQFAATVGSGSRGNIFDTTWSSEASRMTYQKHGFLVGRSKGRVADGLSGASGLQRHKPLSRHAMLFNGDLVGGTGGMLGTTPHHRDALRKPSKQWRMQPESGFVFDPTRSLPVPRGGWGAQQPTAWPETIPFRDASPTVNLDRNIPSLMMTGELQASKS
jgi:hypothetical protein